MVQIKHSKIDLFELFKLLNLVYCLFNSPARHFCRKEAQA